MDYIKFKLTDLPKDEFYLILKPSVQRDLIELAATKMSNLTKREYGKYKDLALYLKERCTSLKNVKPRNLWNNYLTDWKNSRKYIPIDYALELHNFINKELNEDDILFVKHKIPHNKNGTKFPWIYDEDLAYLGEAIRVEGHIKKDLRRIDISNKNIDFLNRIKKIIKKYVSKKSIYEIINIEADIPKNKKIISVEDNKGNNFNFNVYKAARSDKIKIRFYEKDKNFEKIYFIKLNNRIIKIKNRLIEGEIVSKSTYDISSCTLNVSITNTTFTRLMHILLKIPKGNKSKIISIPIILELSPLSVKKYAIQAILDSESWIENTRIRIGMNSRKYLSDLKYLLKDLRIRSNLEDKHNILAINGTRELSKINRIGYTLISKRNKLLKCLNKIDSRSKDGDIRDTILLFLDNKIITIKDAYLSFNNKHKYTSYTRLNKCVKIGLLKRDINVWPHHYSLTKKGKEFLNKVDKEVKFYDLPWGRSNSPYSIFRNNE